MATKQLDRIRAIARSRRVLTNRDVANELGISRQAAHKHLRALVERGELRAEGEGRGSRYVAAEPEWTLRYETAGLAEDRVWVAVAAAVPDIGGLSAPAEAVFHYALTELVNNAIDHSSSPTVELRVRRSRDGALVVEVVDEGVGIFEHVRRELGLGSDLEALEEISKGKTTTMPERHTGEGIFFTSKVADRFVIESGRLTWVVDNVVQDVAVGERSPRLTGTLVRFEARPDAPRDLRSVFDAYTDGHDFSRTRTTVKLFAYGTTFVSRSEAKRLVRGLEKFREVIVDFAGVHMVGQGFADEIFRVWQAAHAEIRLVPVNMVEPVAFMVERARRARAPT